MKTKEEILNEQGLQIGFKSTYSWDAILDAMEEYASQFQQEWIPVEVRLPEEEGEYDVTVMSSFKPIVVSVSYSLKLKWLCKNNVIAWKPRPQPYNPTKS